MDDQQTDYRSGEYEAVTASDLVENSMTEFAAHTRRMQLPSPVDGLKTIHRRVLWTMRHITSPQKGMRMVGEIMELHPHGDQAIVDTISRMMQPFQNVKELVACDGNYGTYRGDPPGAMRYLDIYRSQFAQDVYFNGVNTSTFDYVPRDIGEGTEPKFLIPRIPMGLLTSVFALSIGYKPNILPLNFNEVCKLTDLFIQNADTMIDQERVYRDNPEKLLPDSFVPNLLRNAPELKSKIRQGSYVNPTVYDGTMRVRSGIITIFTLPHGVSPKDKAEQLDKAVNKKGTELNKYVQQIRPMGKDLMHLEIVLKRGVDPFRILDIIKKSIRFSATAHPNMLWTGTDDELKTYDIPRVMETWYEQRKRSVLSDFKHTQNDLVDNLRKMEAKYIVIDHAQEVIDIVRGSPDVETAVVSLRQRFTDLSYKQAEYLTGLQISQLTGSGIEELKQGMADVKQKLTDLRNRFARIREIIRDNVRDLAGKYNIPRQAALPSFTGSVFTGTGVVQYGSESERHELILSFKPENLRVVLYPKGSVCKYRIRGSEIEAEDDLEFPKEFPADDWFVSRKALKHTLILRTDGRIHRVSGLIHRKGGNERYIPVSDTFTAVSFKGQVRKMSATDITLRRHIEASGLQSDIMDIFRECGDDLVVVHGNPKEPNTLRMDRVQSVTGDLHKCAMGRVMPIGVFRTDEPFIVNVPPDCMSRNLLRQLYIEDAAAVLNGRQHLIIPLTKKKTDNGASLSKTAHGLHTLKPPE